jgi:glycosyltransferase involved in cell wall biosynthesis
MDAMVTTQLAEASTTLDAMADSQPRAPQPAPQPVGPVTVPVTVVVCSRNRESVIGRCLDSVLLARPAEIIVVDGNSSDDTVSIARAKGVRVVSDNGMGLGAARQLGAQLARTNYVVFVDTDVVIEPDTLRLLYAEAVAQGYDALQAELRTWSTRPSYWQGAERWRRQVQMRKGIAAVLGCQVTLMRRDLLMAVGFDRAFQGAAEDADFCFRARSAGAVIAHSERAVAFHEDRFTLPQFIGQKIWHGRGLARMLTRYGRDYFNHAAKQVDTSLGATKLNARYVPYVVVSWSCTALGVALESIRIACNPDLRHELAAEITAPRPRA